MYNKNKNKIFKIIASASPFHHQVRHHKCYVNEAFNTYYQLKNCPRIFETVIEFDRSLLCNEFYSFIKTSYSSYDRIFRYLLWVTLREKKNAVKESFVFLTPPACSLDLKKLWKKCVKYGINLLETLQHYIPFLLYSNMAIRTVLSQLKMYDM